MLTPEEFQVVRAKGEAIRLLKQESYDRGASDMRRRAVACCRELAEMDPEDVAQAICALPLTPEEAE